MANIVESESDKHLLALLIQVKEDRDKWKSLAGELHGQVKMAIAYKLAMNITGLQSLEKADAKAKEMGL